MTTTPVAVPGPALLVVIVKTAFSPALIGLFAAVLVVVTVGLLQTIDALAFGMLPVLVPVVLATLLIVAQVAKVVAAVSVTVLLAPGADRAEVAGQHVRVGRGVDRAVGAVLRPRVAGGQVVGDDTPVAVPVPGRPLLVVVIVKTAFSPALIGLFAAVLVVVTVGGRQTIDALAFGIVPVFVPVVLATLLIVAQVAKVVAAVSVTALLAPGARVPKLQVSTSGLGAVLIEQSVLFSDHV